MTDTKGSTSLSPDAHALQKEWDEISCPICMEHPHNAVLLICSSHEKGCRSYICDTSYRHSNCLDRFKKLKVEHSSDHRHSHSISRPGPRVPHPHTSEQSSGSPEMRTIEDIRENNHSLRHLQLEGQVEEGINLGEYRVRDTLEQNSLRCPLCRGTVTGWSIVKEARQYWDLKPRSCSRESCLFSGNYGELRRHARRDHPTTRPADVDPSRQRAWRHLEHRREYGDILSAIRSAMPGAVMFGDYVVNDDDVLDDEFGSETGPWWATLFLFHMMSRPTRSGDEFGGSPRTWRMRRRPSSLNRYLWGENLLGLQDGHDDDNNDEIVMTRRRRGVRRLRENTLDRLQDDHDADEETPRRRRRGTGSRPDGDRP